MTRRQASRPDRIEALGLQVDREMLRSITGRSARQGAGRIHGGISLGLTREMRVEALDELGEELIADYTSTAYASNFGSLDRLRPLRRDAPEIARLEAGLVATLGAPDPEALLTPPQLLDWEQVSGFRFSSEPRSTGPHDDIVLSDYLASLGDPAAVTTERLREDNVRVVDRDSARRS